MVSNMIVVYKHLLVVILKWSLQWEITIFLKFELLFLAMIDIYLVREQQELFQKSYTRMKRPELLLMFKDLVEKDKQLRALKGELDTLRAQRNVLSQEVNALRKAEKSIDAVLNKVKELPKLVKKKEEEYIVVENRVVELLKTLPNLIHNKVPYGASDKDNIEIKKWGKIPKFDFPVKNHVEILE